MIDPPRLSAPGLRHVFLRDMVLPASIGVHPHEHAAAQRVRINVDLSVSEEPAEAGPAYMSRDLEGLDDLRRVVDYESIADRVRAIVAAGHVKLVETLAERIAGACFVDRRVRLARIRVEKLDVFADTVAVGVEIERRLRDLSTGGVDSQ